MKLEDIKTHWEEAGKRFPTEGKITPTSRDPYLGLLERENIISHLDKPYVALEIGCGDGSHTMHYAKRVKILSGVDVSKSLIKIARKRVISESIKNVDYTVGSVLDLNKIYSPQQFNCVISQRCLINLPEWNYQKDVIFKVHNLLQKDGLFLLTEGFQEELDNLNAIRRKFNLSEIKTADYNKNLIRTNFEAFVNQYFDIIEVRQYGAYLFLSRIFHPLAVLPNEPKHDSRLNEVSMEISQIVQMPDLEKYSYNLFYVLRKL